MSKKKPVVQTIETGPIRSPLEVMMDPPKFRPPPLKTKQQLQHERWIISSFIEMVERSIQVRDFEVGGGTYKFVQHDSNTYTIVLAPGREKLRIKIEVE